MPVARAEGVADHVVEHCGRVPYFEALHYLTRADAIMALGSDDPGYSASKIFPCLLARRPLLVLFHHGSPVFDFIEPSGRLHAYAFEKTTSNEQLVSRMAEEWFANGGLRMAPAPDPKMIDSITVRAKTRTLARVFDQVLARASSQ